MAAVDLARPCTHPAAWDLPGRTVADPCFVYTARSRPGGHHVDVRIIDPVCLRLGRLALVRVAATGRPRPPPRPPLPTPYSFAVSCRASLLPPLCSSHARCARPRPPAPSCRHRGLAERPRPARGHAPAPRTWPCARAPHVAMRPAPLAPLYRGLAPPRALQRPYHRPLLPASSNRPPASRAHRPPARRAAPLTASPHAAATSCACPLRTHARRPAPAPRPPPAVPLHPAAAAPPSSVPSGTRPFGRPDP
nr:vegetative cell wall protein gp1-like [Aegilops tauschii subsp. strangulata]